MNGFLSSFEAIFATFVAINLVAVALNHIDDTDETYGYWEPLHYLLYGIGLQTWEYAPVFAIRTYAFIYPFSIFAGILAKLGVPKVLVFRSIKCLLGGLTAYCEAHFVCSIRDKFGNGVGYVTMLLMLVSPGVFFASTAYLPSAVCMNLLMLSNAAFLQDRRIWSILWGCLAVLCTGWPFVGLLFAPLGLHMVCSVYQIAVAKKVGNTFMAGIWGVVVLALHGVVMVAVIQSLVLALDYLYYQKWTSPTLNILLYNAIGGNGDELYGIESASYYVLNLVLNMGLAWPLAVLLPLVLVASLPFRSLRAVLTTELLGVGAVLVGQVFLWLLVLFSRPHKVFSDLLFGMFSAYTPHCPLCPRIPQEERFMYPIYPLLAFVAALSVNAVLGWINVIGGEAPNTKVGVSHVVRRYRGGALLVLALLGAALGIARVTSNHVNYGGYMKLWETAGAHITQAVAANSRTVNVCTGSEWYQFTSHFFLPASTRLQYVRDGFTGILPHHFAAESGTGVAPAQPFNDLNREEPARYVELSQCDYLVLLVDRNKAVQESELRAQLLREEGSISAQFRQVAAEKVISPEFSPSSLLRAYYVPNFTAKSVKFKDYVLLERNPVKM